VSIEGDWPSEPDDPAAPAPPPAPRSRRAGSRRAANRPQRKPSQPRRIAARSGYALQCLVAVVALIASGLAYLTVSDVRSIGSSHAIVSGPSVGAQNILLMGIESRTYWNGTILPPRILAKLHAGSAAAVAAGAGGNATNTLILIHVFAGGKKAVGFSIPRDDWVQFADTVGPQQTGKIDQAYGVSMFYQEQKIAAADPGISQNRLAFLGNEAGQAAAVASVERLTGVHIDHFAAVNLYGFYELAKVLGGVEVCLNHAVYDKNSGADFPAGYQHLNPAQALAFVRQRDGLPNGDLDRTHRQQAFLDSVMQQLRQEGVLDDLTKVDALLNVARQYVIADAGWNLLDFAAQMKSLTSQDLVFHTLPIVGYETIDGQDANTVNPAYIKSIVQAAFYPKPSAAHARHRGKPKTTAPAGPPATVDVLNGSGVSQLAHRVSAALVTDGFKAGTIGDTAYRPSTEVLYGAGASAGAGKIASLFGATAVASASVARGHVEVLLGAGATVPTASPSTSPTVSPSPTPSVVIPTTGPQGGAVSAVNGIPCVN
jgi:LCP family protein required for cell wall assembly